MQFILSVIAACDKKYLTSGINHLNRVVATSGKSYSWMVDAYDNLWTGDTMISNRRSQRPLQVKAT